MATKLTPLGKFVNRHGVMVPYDKWSEIWKTLVDKLDQEERGEECEDAWKLYLEELAAGCQFLLKDDNFLRIVSEMEELDLNRHCHYTDKLPI